MPTEEQNKNTAKSILVLLTSGKSFRNLRIDWANNYGKHQSTGSGGDWHSPKRWQAKFSKCIQKLPPNALLALQQLPIAELNKILISIFEENFRRNTLTFDATFGLFLKKEDFFKQAFIDALKEKAKGLKQTFQDEKTPEKDKKEAATAYFLLKKYDTNGNLVFREHAQAALTIIKSPATADAGSKEGEHTKLRNEALEALHHHRPPPAAPSPNYLSATFQNENNKVDDKVDEHILLSILPKPNISLGHGTTDKQSLYGGLIRFATPNDTITEHHLTALDKPQSNGEVGFASQMQALKDSVKDKTPIKVTVDFVVAEEGRNHFSVLSVTVNNTADGMDVSVAHKDTLHNSKLPENSLQSKLETAVKAAIKKTFSVQPSYKYEPTAPQQKANSCGDRVILSMLQAHNPSKLHSLLQDLKDSEDFKDLEVFQNFNPDEVDEVDEALSDGDSSNKRNENQPLVDFLLDTKNEALLRKFTCHAAESTPSLENRLLITNAAEMQEPESVEQLSFLRGADTWYQAKNNGKDSDVEIKSQINEWLSAALVILNGEGKPKDDTTFAWKKQDGSNTPSVVFDHKNQLATISLTMTQKGRQPVDITLTRQEEIKEKTPVVTWRCKAEGLSDLDKFKIIAANSLALRKAQGLGDAAYRIKIFDLKDGGTQKRRGDLFNSTPENPSLSDKEVDLIKGHLLAGYKHIEYNGVVYNGLKLQSTHQMAVSVCHGEAPGTPSTNVHRKEGESTAAPQTPRPL